MSSFNAIWIGYPFSQDFETDDGAIADGASLWLSLRESQGRREVKFAHLDLVRISSTLFRLTLTAEQTGTLRPGVLHGDFRVRTGGSDRILGQRLIVPVEMAQ